MGAPEMKLACPHLINLDQGRPRLIGKQCRNCGEVYFAGSGGCTRCLSTDMKTFDIGNQGKLWSWTVQGFLPKSPYNSGETELDFKPYGVGYVEMSSGIKVESRLTIADPEALKIGMPMVLELVPYGKTAEGESVFTFAFAPAAVAEKEQVNG